MKRDAILTTMEQSVPRLCRVIEPCRPKVSDSL